MYPRNDGQLEDEKYVSIKYSDENRKEENIDKGDED